MKKRFIMIVLLFAALVCGSAFASSGLDLRALESSLETGFSTPKDLQTMLKNAWMNGYDHCRISSSEDGASFAIEVSVRGLAAGLRTLNRSESEEDARRLLQARESLLDHCRSLCEMLAQEGWNDLHFSFVLMDDEKVLKNEYASHAVMASITVTNSQPVSIESWIEAWNAPVWAEQTVSAVSVQENPIVTREPTYILNTNSKKFHYPTCDSVGKTKEQNRKEFFGQRNELISSGYMPCGVCHP